MLKLTTVRGTTMWFNIDNICWWRQEDDVTVIGTTDGSTWRLNIEFEKFTQEMQRQLCPQDVI